MKFLQHLKKLFIYQTPGTECKMEVASPTRNSGQPINSLPPKITPPSHKIFLGIDFGTVFIKAAYKEPGPKIYALKFNHSATQEGFLRSIASHECGSDILRIGVEAKNGDTYRFSKMLCAEDAAPFIFNAGCYSSARSVYGNIPPGVIAALILAHAIEHAKNLASNDLKKRRYTNLNYEVRICIPIDYLTNNPVKDYFEKIFALAEEVISIYPQESLAGAFQFAKVVNLIAKFKEAQYNPKTCKIQHRPEVVAELQSYTLSLNRIVYWPLAVYDIGGGTTELTVFKTLKDSSFNIYATNIIPLGSVYIGDDPFRFRAITNKAMHIWHKAQNRNKRAPYQAHWAEAHVYLSGGGSNVKGATSYFARSDDDVTGRYNHQFTVGELPVPDNYVGLNGTFKRYCVAYGLAIPEEPDYLFPDEIHEQPPLNRRPPEPRNWL